MKRLAAMGLITAILLAGCGNGAAGTPGGGSFLLKESVALTVEMDRLAENSEYLRFMTASEQLLPTFEKAAAQEYGAPEHVYRIPLTDGLLRKIIQAEEPVSDETMESLRLKVNGTVLASAINASQGAETLAATSVLAWEKSYREPDGWDGNQLLVLDYGGDFSSMVSFTRSGEGVIRGAAMFLATAGKAPMDQLQETLNEPGLAVQGWSGEEVREILAEK